LKIVSKKFVCKKNNDFLRINSDFLLKSIYFYLCYIYFIRLFIPMSKPYRTLDEIVDIFWITVPKAKSIIKKYKVDAFTNKGYKVHVKDFYTAYTRHYNPSLFDMKPIKTNTQHPKDISDIFHELFGCAYSVQ